MDLFDHEHYVPILLTRRGERAALTSLDPGIKLLFTPLFVVQPVERDVATGLPKKTMEDHLASLPQDLAKAWGARRAFLDGLFLSDDPLQPSGEHPLEWLTREGVGHGLKLVPVVSTGRSQAYRSAAEHVIARDGAGACIRLMPSEWPSAQAAGHLDQLLGELGLTAQDVDLVLDLQGEVGTFALGAIRSEIATLPHLQEWRSLTVAGTAMPDSMPSGQGTHQIARTEWSIWNNLVGGPQPAARLPTFGDYVIASPVPPPDVDGRLLNISATLRYTAGAEWLIEKGGLYKASGGRGKGGAAMYPVAGELLRKLEFIGGHCEFETWTAMTAMSGTTGGSPEVWRRYATHHHLKLITEQLASLNLEPSNDSAPDA